MLEKCQKYSVAINAKGKPFPTEPGKIIFNDPLAKQDRNGRWHCSDCQLTGFNADTAVGGFGLHIFDNGGTVGSDFRGVHPK